MTCIVAIVDDSGISMGCDSFIGTKHMHLLLPPNENKLFTVELKVVGGPTEKMIFGFSGSLRSCQLIKHNLSLPIFDIDDEQTDIQFLINEVIPAIKRVHKKHGVLSTVDGVESSESLFLLGWRKKIYCIGEDYSVLPSSTGYLALGAGEDVAFGSLQSTNPLAMNTSARIHLALEASESNSNHVRKPFYIESI